MPIKNESGIPRKPNDRRTTEPQKDYPWVLSIFRRTYSGNPKIIVWWGLVYDSKAKDYHYDV